MKKYMAILLSGILILSLASCQSAAVSQAVPPVSSVNENISVPSPSAAPTHTFTLLAAGDNLIHDVIYTQAKRRGGDGGYNFTPAYSAVEPIIRSADIAVINQETILASDVAEVSSYPCFCSPTALGEQLIELGFDVFTQANNHSYDKGAKGIRACMDFWDKHPQSLAVGMYRDKAEHDKIHYTTVNGIKLAFLAAAEQTNGLTLPSHATEGVWLLSDTAGLEQKLAEARQNADFVVFSPHWGVEGSDTPSDEQRRMANLLVQWGADLVLGTHPHVLQPCETVTRGDGTQGLVIYSLGNFISAQRDKSNMAGGLLEVTLEKNDGDTSRTEIIKHRFIPTVTQYDAGYSNVRIIPFADYTQELAAAHGIHAYDSGFGMKYLTDLYKRIYPRCAATEIATPKTPNTADLTDDAVDALCKANKVTGMSVAAFENEKIVYTHSYGFSNVEKQIAADEDTVYRTASIAKAVTAMTAMTLYDEGRLNLDGDISQYTGFKVRNPKYPDDVITTRQLMTHTGSITDTQAYYNSIEHTPFAGLSQLAKRGIFSGEKPGRSYNYSNLSGGMVGAVASGAANEPLWTLSERKLFIPLGISATYLSKTVSEQSRVAAIYQNGQKIFDPIRSGTAESYYSRIPNGEMYMLGQGDLYVMATDLARLGMVLAGDGSVDNVNILKDTTVKMINSVQFHLDAGEKSPEVSRGLGVQLLPQMLQGRDFAGHQGNAYGMIGCLFYEPEKGTGVAFLTNGCHTGKHDGTVYDINKDITEIIYRSIFSAK